MTHSSDDNLQFHFHVIWRPLMASMCTCITCCTETHADIKKYKYKKVNHLKNKYFSKCYMLPGWNLIFYLFGYYTKSYTGSLYKKNMFPYISGCYKIKIPTGSLSTKGLYLLVWLYPSLYCQWQSDLALLYLSWTLFPSGCSLLII